MTDRMFSAAAGILSELSPALSDPNGSLFPPLESVREISYRVAIAVAREAVRAGLTRMRLDSLENAVTTKMWIPQYVPLIRC